jgi:hypothetical protein
MIRSSLIGIYNTIKTNPVLERNKHTYFQNLEIDSTVSELNRNALSQTFNLDSELLEELINECKTNVTFPSLKFDGTAIKSDKGEIIDYNNPKSFQKECIWYEYRNIREWDVFKKIAYDPTILEIAKRYLGNNPILRNEYMWWSFPAKGDSNEAYDSPRYWFHYDIDDFKFLKLFIYLNDVDEETGPHIVVKNTHKQKPLKYKLNRRIESSKLDGFFDNKEIVTLTGKKGTCFFEDTFTYHNGTPPQKPRIVLQLEYSLTNLKLG